jgi:hypothetical protein
MSSGSSLLAFWNSASAALRCPSHLSARGTLTLMNNALLSAHFLIADHSLPMPSTRYSLRKRRASSIISVGPESGTCAEFTETPQSLLRHS